MSYYLYLYNNIRTFFVLLRWLENHGLEQGFAFTITHSDKDKDDGFPRRRIMHTQKVKYIINKKKHIQMKIVTENIIQIIASFILMLTIEKRTISFTLQRLRVNIITN